MHAGVASNQEGLWETLLVMISPPRMMFVFFLGAAAAGLTTAHVSNIADDSADVHTIAKEASPLLEGDPHPIDWLAVEVIMKEFKNLSNFAFTAGDQTGRKFKFTKGNVTMQTPMYLASASKLPAAMAIAGTVADGHLTFDTLVSTVFSWWTRDSTDPRSRVTLRHLLSFTSGFYWPDESGFVPCMELNGTSVNISTEDCAKQVYDQAPFAFEPGTTWAYNSFHLQVAAAMAAKAANLTVQGLLHTYLIDKLGLSGTSFLGGENPYIAAAMQTTPDDYDKILLAYTSYTLLPKEITDQMELDYLSPPYASHVANSSVLDMGFMGHYSMSNWYECLNLTESNYPTSAWCPECKAAMVHQDLGLFGYYPIIDRKNQIYMQVAQETDEGLNSTGLGVENSVILRYLVSRLVYKALGKPPPYLPIPPAADASWQQTLTSSVKRRWPRKQSTGVAAWHRIMKMISAAGR